MKRLVAVALREARRVRQQPVLWALLFPIPLAMTLILLGVFQRGVVSELPVSVLDQDRSAVSRIATRWLEATRGARLVTHVEDMGQARSSILEGESYAVLVIPPHFERDLVRGRAPHVSLLYNEQYLTVGNNLSADAARSVSAASATIVSLRGQ